jgi:hypothetical protein
MSLILKLIQQDNGDHSKMAESLAWHSIQQLDSEIAKSLDDKGFQDV